MTEICFFKNAEHKIIGFTSKGHAGFSRRGKDIVCSSISVLTINTINSLEKIAGVDTEVYANAKDAEMTCMLKGESNVSADTLLNSLELGILGIVDNYGSKYCKVTYKEE